MSSFSTLESSRIYSQFPDRYDLPQIVTVNLAPSCWCAYAAFMYRNPLPISNRHSSLIGRVSLPDCHDKATPILWPQSSREGEVREAEPRGCESDPPNCSGQSMPMQTICSKSSREAAKECSPRRKPWVASTQRRSPEGAKERLRHRFRHGRPPALRYSLILMITRFFAIHSDAASKPHIITFGKW